MKQDTLYVTDNFKFTGETLSSTETNRFMKNMRMGKIVNGELYDIRTGSIVRNYRPDLMETYFNYIEFNRTIAVMNDYKLGSKTFLLKAGYLPIGMEPLVTDAKFTPSLSQMLRARGIKYREEFPNSFRENNINYVGNIKDIWVHKLDIAQFVPNKPVHAITVRDAIFGIGGRR